MIREAETVVMSDKAHHYTKLQDVPLHIQKYWKIRRKIFSYYDEGVYMTDDAWFGVTPEPIAKKIAHELPMPVGISRGLFAIGDSDSDADERAVEWNGMCPTVIDLFAGAGGNTIQFALSGRWQRVVAIERDRATLACAQNNAAVAGVPEGVIIWIHGDCFNILRRLRAGECVALLQEDEYGEMVEADSDDDIDVDDPDLAYRLDNRETVIFASPPWGGVGYSGQAVFDLSAMEPYNLRALHTLCDPLAHALYLPRTSDLQQLADVYRARSRPPGPPMRCEPKLNVVQYCMHGFSKALVAYFPAGNDPTVPAAGTRASLLPARAPVTPSDTE